MPTITVDTFVDVIDPGDGVTSLREAVAQAISGDVIVFDYGASSRSTEFLLASTITIPAGLAITIDGFVDTATPRASVTGGDTDDGGGALFQVEAGGDLTVRNLIFDGNRAVGSDGTAGVDGMTGANGDASVDGDDGTAGTAGGDATMAVGGFINAGVLTLQNVSLIDIRGTGGNGGAGGDGGRGGTGGDGTAGADGASGGNNGGPGVRGGAGGNGGDGGAAGGGGDGADGIAAILNQAGATLNLEVVDIGRAVAFGGAGGDAGDGGRGGNGGDGGMGGDGGDGAVDGGNGGDGGDGGNGGDATSGGNGGDGGDAYSGILNFGTVNADLPVAFWSDFSSAGRSGLAGAAAFQSSRGFGAVGGAGGDGFFGSAGSAGDSGRSGSSGSGSNAGITGAPGFARDLLTNSVNGSGSISDFSRLVRFDRIETGDALAEGSGGGETTHSIRIDDALGNDLTTGTVSWEVLAGTADASDFFGGALPSGTYTLGTGAILIRLAADDIDEGDETFTLRLFNPSAGIAMAETALVFNEAARSFTITGDDMAGSNDTITGTEDADTLPGTSGNDTIVALGGNDTILGSAGADVIYGGDDVDTVDYSLSQVRVVVRINAAGIGGDAEGDVLDGVENLIGSQLDDVLIAIAGNNTLQGLGGNDTINGGNDDDVLIGGTGDNILRGQGGNDSLGASRGNDSLTGGIGDDTLEAGAGNDLLLGQVGTDLLYGGDGLDELRGGSGIDILYGGDDDDILFGQGNMDTIYGGSDDDTLNGAAGADLLFGGVGNDRLFGGSAADTIEGGAGDDLMNGGTQADRFLFDLGHGNDTISGFEDDIDTIVLDYDLVRLAGSQKTIDGQAVFDQFGQVVGASVQFDFGKAGRLKVNAITEAEIVDDILIV